MHEGGLARGVARALTERDLRPEQIRLAVAAGHQDPAAFEAELRAHLTAEMPEAAATAAPACPNRASEAVGEITVEKIQIELLEPLS